MNRYKNLFNHLKKKNEACFTPFIIIGDPNFEDSLSIIDILIKNGADALELGIPFSDPIADGITIQKSNLRSFSSGINVQKCFKFIQKIRIKYPNIPIGILVYANIIFNKGIKQFYSECSFTGIDSVLIPDVPLQEYKIFLKYANIFNINSIFICPPNADKNIIEKISLYGTGYIYLLSRSGVTGTKNEAILPDKKIINMLKQESNTPLLQGFGISDTMYIKNLLKIGISGVICGSVIIEKIEKYYKKNIVMYNSIGKLVKKLKKSTILKKN
ncbi:tryptophan synthase subunit alpha [Buchnera aphidicola (Kurisakia onigurumii)]|uniref:tryptophan synthase subunit alpha n=1 Tax=Buchnera aphidicola TaxID=9 RepID=UPI0031B6EA62